MLDEVGRGGNEKEEEVCWKAQKMLIIKNTFDHKKCVVFKREIKNV